MKCQCENCLVMLTAKKCLTQFLKFRVNYVSIASDVVLCFYLLCMISQWHRYGLGCPSLGYLGCKSHVSLISLISAAFLFKLWYMLSKKCWFKEGRGFKIGVQGNCMRCFRKCIQLVLDSSVRKGQEKSLWLVGLFIYF